MANEPQDRLPSWMAEALATIPWEEVRVPHLPLRLKPGIAEAAEDERERILAMAKRRRDQYVADGWQDQADVITLFMAEIQR
jgi:hypothetical protein